MSITITLIAQVLAFTILIWLVNKHLWGPLSAVLEARQKKIADGLAASEKGLQEQEQAAIRAQEVVDEAKKKATDIIAQAQARSSQVIEESKGKATEEAGQIIAGAQAEIDQEINRAKDGLRKQVSDLAIAGASKIVGKEIDANAHKKALKDLIAQI
ncbi:MAG TPA: F0F1 ATP synthase subunit B [Leucothrix mucor]|uniref:ATP synthase subunit b n=1 Tax=Leucothrix mucor TaxID=45248 RepID=A0A7V2WW94_LEUMU|nr:F0F1 ATP synthase subunit B [Leucothrix mucor]